MATSTNLARQVAMVESFSSVPYELTELAKSKDSPDLGACLKRVISHAFRRVIAALLSDFAMVSAVSITHRRFSASVTTKLLAQVPRVRLY